MPHVYASIIMFSNRFGGHIWIMDFQSWCHLTVIQKFNLMHTIFKFYKHQIHQKLLYFVSFIILLLHLFDAFFIKFYVMHWLHYLVLHFMALYGLWRRIANLYYLRKIYTSWPKLELYKYLFVSIDFVMEPCMYSNESMEVEFYFISTISEMH